MNYYVVTDGVAYSIRGCNVPPLGQYGLDWILVSASSAAVALYYADAITGVIVFDEAHARSLFEDAR